MMNSCGFFLDFLGVAVGTAATGAADADGIDAADAVDAADALTSGEISKSFTLLLYYSFAFVIKNSPFLKSTLAMSPLSSLPIRI